jgi:hypothetical protein
MPAGDQTGKTRVKAAVGIVLWHQHVVVVNAVLVFLRQHEDAGGLANGLIFLIKLHVRAAETAAHQCVHADAPYPVEFAEGGFHIRLVGRAAEDRGVLQVSANSTLGQEHGTVGVIAVFRLVVQVSSYPRWSAAYIAIATWSVSLMVVRKPPIVIFSVEMHGHLELTDVVEALGGLAGLLGLGQGGQEQRRQHRDDRNDHQQLDERETGAVTTWILHGAFSMHSAAGRYSSR